MSAEPTFTRVPSTDLYWLDPATAITGFLASQGAGLSDTPTLSQTWADADGIYLLLGQPVADASAFLDQLEAYLATFRPGAAPRVLWILDPADSYLVWTLQELFVAPGATAGSWVVAQRLDFTFADYTLILSGGGAVAPGELSDEGWGFIFSDVANVPALTFYTTDGQVGAAPRTSQLNMQGGAAGCWRARFDMAAPGNGPDAFDQLDCAIRYFVARPVTDEIHTINFVVLTQPADTALSLYANLDSQRPFDGDRSHLGFFSWTTPGTAPTLHSGYATARGYGVDLTPQVASSVAPAARLVFGVAPFYSGGEVPGGYYLTPDGGFGLTVVQAEAEADTDIDRLICGASALEYLGLPASGGSSVQFIGGQPAYAQPATPTTPAGLTTLGTTAWLYAEAATGQTIRYYAQPEDAPYYTAVGTGAPEDDDGPSFLNFLEVPATHLPAPTAGAGFPMAPFRNLASDMLTDALRIEQMALAPKRRAILADIAAQQSVAPPVSDADPPAATTIGVTPQGLAVGIAADGETWLWSALGQTAESAAIPDLRFTAVSGALKQALLTNNLFMVLGDASVFQTAGSVEYQLTSLDLAVIAALPFDDGVPPEVLTQVSDYMARNNYPLYADLTQFQMALGVASPGITVNQMAVFQRYAGMLSPVVDDWVFQLSPDNWTVPDRQGQTNSYVIYKFNLGRSLKEMVADVSAWTWREAAHPGGDPQAAARDILQIIQTADSRQDDSAGLYRAFNRVVSDPSWTGILALSVTVPLDQLPAPLQPLAAGIDPKAFYAHHLGIAATPYDLVSGAIDFRRSTLFGLIDYENPEDQYFSEDIAFAFRVLQLSVGFQNSVVTTFASRIELMVNRLFGAPTRLFPSVHGNNIILTGAHQVQTLPDGSKHDTYVFSMTEENTFQVNGLVLQTVEILSTDMVTAQAATQDGGSMVTATFRMAGNLRFYEPELFDPFCWGPGVTADGTPTDGYLRFGALSIDMSFNLADPANTTTFRLNDGNLSFDLANSVARDNALVRRFPARLATLITTPDPKLSSPTDDDVAAPLRPEGLGFVSVSAPIDQSVLTQPWYGLNYTIDLGTLGALAGSAGMSLAILAAWSPGGGEAPAVYIGVRLPGTKDAFGVSLPLQGILKLGFRTIEFLVDNEVGQPRTYTLRLRDFALRFLGLSFPPGHNDVVLFGNPDQTGGDKVGWYAAYSQENDPKKSTRASSRRIVRQARATTRALPPPEATP